MHLIATQRWRNNRLTDSAAEGMLHALKPRLR